nr:MAG: hypothetical protein [Microvirus sp.]
MYKKRQKLNKKYSKKIYKKGLRTANKNFRGNPMRGGYRL